MFTDFQGMNIPTMTNFNAGLGRDEKLAVASLCTPALVYHGITIPCPVRSEFQSWSGSGGSSKFASSLGISLSPRGSTVPHAAVPIFFKLSLSPLADNPFTS